MDLFEFAARQGVIEEVVPMAALPGLSDVVAGESLHCVVSGERDGEGKSWLSVRISGQVEVVCQRCLEAMALPLRIDSRLLLMRPGQPWPDEELGEDGWDAVAIEEEKALLPMIEEEVLLALPIAPRHATCTMPAAAGDGSEASPFAVLAKLKKGV